MKDVKDFDDVRWDDGKPTVTDYVWGRDNQTASLIRAYKDEIERLREALRVIADGDAPREHAIIYRSDGVHSKHDKCKHGAWMYDGCEDCVTEYARAALGEGENE